MKRFFLLFFAFCTCAVAQSQPRGGTPTSISNGGGTISVSSSGSALISPASGQSTVAQGDGFYFAAPPDLPTNASPVVSGAGHAKFNFDGTSVTLSINSAAFASPWAASNNAVLTNPTITGGTGAFTTLSTSGAVTIGGNLLPSTDNTKDVGGYSNRFLNLWLGGTIVLGLNDAYITALGNAKIGFLNNNGTGASDLIFGQAASSLWPMLHRNGTGLESKLADNSAYTSLAASSLTLVGPVHGSTPHFFGSDEGYNYTGVGLSFNGNDNVASFTRADASGSLQINANDYDLILGAAHTIVLQAPARLKGYTVATLPAGTQGDYAFVSDALAPSFLVTVVGGGSAKTVVFFDGTNWVAE